MNVTFEVFIANGPCDEFNQGLIQSYVEIAKKIEREKVDENAINNVTLSFKQANLL